MAILPHIATKKLRYIDKKISFIPMSDKDKIFKALADKTRRGILFTLELNGPLSITMLRENHKMTRQAITKHVMILKKSGLISIRKRGREQICRGNFKQLEEVDYWLKNFKEYWDEDAFSIDNYLR